MNVTTEIIEIKAIFYPLKDKDDAVIRKMGSCYLIYNGNRALVTQQMLRKLSLELSSEVVSDALILDTFAVKELLKKLIKWPVLFKSSAPFTIFKIQQTIIEGEVEYKLLGFE